MSGQYMFDKTTIIDQKDFDLEEVSPVVKEYITTIILGVMVRQIVEAMR